MGSNDDRTLVSLWQRRLTRRRLLAGGTEIAALTALGASVGCTRTSGEERFAAISPSNEDAVVVPDGYRADILLRWGDPILANAPGLETSDVAAGGLLAGEAADRQLSQFGYKPTSAIGVDMMPQTYHVEAVVQLDRVQ